MKSFVALAASVLLVGCSSWVGHNDRFAYVVPLYRVEIVQGNVVTKEQAALVKPGMTRDQVRGVLGSPLLTDPFHADRWDYLFTIRRPGTEPQRRSIVAVFEGDTLKRLDMPEGQLPTENEFVAAIDNVKRKIEPRVLELTEAQRKALPVPARKDSPTEAPAGATRTFPPLEPR